MDFTFKILPFVLVFVANFLLSWLYYSPVVPWFKSWIIGIGGDPDKTQMTQEDKESMPRLMIGAVIASMLLSYGLQIVIHSMHIATFLGGMQVGFVLWIAFVVTHSLNTQFEGRRPIVLVINNVLYLVTYVLFAGIVAVM